MAPTKRATLAFMWGYFGSSKKADLNQNYRIEQALAPIKRPFCLPCASILVLLHRLIRTKTRIEQVLAPTKRATLAFMWGYFGSSKKADLNQNYRIEQALAPIKRPFWLPCGAILILSNKLIPTKLEQSKFWLV